MLMLNIMRRKKVTRTRENEPKTMMNRTSWAPNETETKNKPVRQWPTKRNSMQNKMELKEEEHRTPEWSIEAKHDREERSKKP